MSSIPLPALDVRAPQQQQDPTEQYARLLQLRQIMQNAPLQRQALQQQAQSGQLELQQQQQAANDQKAFRTAMADPSYQGNTLGEIADKLAKQGSLSPATYQQMKKSDLEHQQSLATLTKDQLDNAKKAHDATQELYNNVLSMPDDQLAANWPQIAQQYDSIPGNQKMPLNPQQPMSKDQLKQFAPLVSMQNAYIDQALKRQKEQTDLQQTQGKSDPNSPFYAPSAASVAMGTAPGAAQIQAGEVKQAARKAGAEAGARQPYEMSLAAQRQALSQGDPNAAAQLLVQGDATLTELKSRGATPDFIAKTLFAANRLSGGKYNAQSADAQFKVAQSPANVAFFGSANSLTDKGGTLDQLAAAAKDIPQGKIPVFNTVADVAKAAAGDGPIAKYASILLGVSDDYAKVMGGGQGSDSSRAQALKLVPTNASPEARAGAIEGIRGSVGSQINSRIGNNPILKRMYGSPEAAPHTDNSAGSLIGKTITQNGHKYKVTAVDKNGKPTAADPVGQ